MQEVFRPARVIFAAALVGFLLTTIAIANQDLMQVMQSPGQVGISNVNYEGQNFSPLDRINVHNVDNLQVKWTFQLGVTDSLEAPPLIVGNTMYVLTPKPNTVYALNLSDPGVLKWSFRPDMPGLEQATACCGAQSRGLAYAEGKIVFNTLDGQLFALDAATGDVVWHNPSVVDLSISETTTNAPLIVDDNVIIGNEGGERGVRGWVAAFDLNSGEEVWKYFNTGPDADMGITDSFDPFYAADQVESPGTSTWFGNSWEQGAGTAWGYFTYDVDSNLFYYGTANCGPWNPDYRRDPATAPGLDEYPNKYCASLIARDATTGEMIWAYSHTPQDPWDFDEPGQNILADIQLDGETRHVIVKPARNGMFYVFDRLTGEILNEPVAYTPVTWNNGIDTETGIPIWNEDALFYTDVPTETPVCPYIAGNNWYNDAYSPQTGLVYFQSENRCGTFMGVAGEYVPGESYNLTERTDIHTGPGGVEGALQAWDPVTNERVWSLNATVGRDNKPVMATAGNLVFGGTDTGVFRAVDARSGEVVWTFRTGGDFRGSPVSYLGPDGRQYLAVITSRAPSDPQIGEDTAADDAGRYRRAGSTLYVFGLP